MDILNEIVLIFDNDFPYQISNINNFHFFLEWKIASEIEEIKIMWEWLVGVDLGDVHLE